MIPTRPPSKSEARAWFEETMRQNGEVSLPMRVYKFMSSDPNSPRSGAPGEQRYYAVLRDRDSL